MRYDYDNHEADCGDIYLLSLYSLPLLKLTKRVARNFAPVFLIVDKVCKLRDFLCMQLARYR